MKEFILKELLPKLKERIRKIDYYAIKSVVTDCDQQLIEELSSYQNDDGGFGNAFEPDSRMVESSILATRAALHYFKFIRNKELLEGIELGMVHYFEDNYHFEDARFYLTHSKVNDYPRAFWWNYENLKKWFVYGNPEGEVLGFLFKHKENVRKLDLDEMVNRYVEYVLSDEFDKAELHHMLNAIHFYHSVDEKFKVKIKDTVEKRLLVLLNRDKDKWDDYVFEPYKAYIVDEGIVSDSKLLDKNLNRVESMIKEFKVYVPWKWDQYMDVFEEIKDEWLGFLYAEMLYALSLDKRIK